MKKELLNSWVEALESGKYEQCTGYLHKDDGFCCLGVLLDIQGEQWKLDQQRRDLIDEIYEPTSQQSKFSLNTETIDKLGLKQHLTVDQIPEDLKLPGGSVVAILSSLNDIANWDFKQIAEFIKTNVKTEED